MRTSKIISTWLVLSLCTLAIIGFTAINIANAAETAKPETKADMKCDMNGGMKGMNKCMMMCSKNNEKNMANMSMAIMILDEAAKDIDAGKTADAKTKIEKAKQLINDAKVSCQKCTDKMPVCNNRCPISGKEIDSANPPASCMYEGMKLGFCCENCKAKWDKCSDEEKNAKLKEIMPESSDTDTMHKKMMHKKGMMEKDMMKEDN